MIFTSTPVPGFGKGKELGFPTVNLHIPEGFELEPGVYAARGNGEPAALFFGTRATLGNPEPTLELHFLDTTVDTPPTDMTVEVVEKIREQQTFASVDELKEQIQKDCEKAHDLLGDTK